MKEMGVSHKKNVNKQQKISEADVQKGSIAKMDIELILSNITTYESAIDAGNLDISTVQTLSTLYQKGIEYFSAFDDTMFADLLNRMQSLLQREDIQVVLNSIEDSKPKVDLQKSSGQILTPAVDFNVSPEDLERYRQAKLDEKDEDEEEPVLSAPAEVIKPKH